MTSGKPAIAVVGASVAGLSVVEGLRRQGFDGRLTLIGEEPHLPYDRPPLSKQILSGDWPEEQLWLRPAEHFDGLDLDLRLGVAATGLDTAARTLALSDGAELRYDRLVIATGVTSRHLPGVEGVRGVYTLRTLDDARALRKELADGRGRRLVIIGAGFVGTEVAAAARGLGLEVCVIDASPTPLAEAVGGEVGGFVADLHREHGVELRTGTAIKAVEADRSGSVTGVRLTDGSLVPADTVLVAIGSRPAVDWLAGSGLRCEDGVHCDATCAAAPGVYAAGDVARWHNARFGTEMRIEHRTNAVEQGLHIVRALLTDPAAEFAPLPYFWSDQYDLKIQSYGWLRGHEEMRMVEGSPEERRFVALYRRGDRLTGVLGVGAGGALRGWRSRLLAGTSWREALAAAA